MGGYVNILTMNQYKIFVSGVQKELKEERRTIKDLIQKNSLLMDHFDVFLFEDSPARSKSAQHSYLAEVRDCDIYIGVLGNQYGNVTKGKLSPVEEEFRTAQKADKEIFLFIKGENSQNDKNREVGIQKLIKEIKDPRKGHSYKRFNNIDELTDSVFDSLVIFLKEKGIVGRGDFDQRICEGATLNDIDMEKVRWFIRTARAKRNFPFDVDTPIKKVFTHLKFLNKGQLTNAAILLFGKNPHQFILQAEIKCAQFAGMEVVKPFLNFKVYNDNLFEQVDKAVGFVLDSIKIALHQQEGKAQAKRTPEIPLFAIEEAIVNAVAHRNYNNTSGVQVMVFADRVEVWNSGSLPSDLSLEDLKKDHTSHPANPLIAEGFYNADYIERFGSGTTEMVSQCKQQGLPEPQFILKRNVEFRTILSRDVYSEDILNKLNLNERQIKAIRFIKEHGEISRKEYVDVASISPRQALSDLGDLVSQKIVFSVGKGRSVKYILRNNRAVIAQ